MVSLIALWHALIIHSVKPSMPGQLARYNRKRPIMEQPDSPLLRLSGELRNRIYKYALYAQWRPLYFLLDPGYNSEKSARSQKSYFSALNEEWNLLKYVCRQLYAETACLEFSFNTLVFEGVPEESENKPWQVAREFAEFLKEISPNKLSLVSQVRLCLNGEFEGCGKEMLVENPSSFEIIGDFCRRYPKMKVDYDLSILVWGTSNLWTLMMRCMYFILAFRHKDLSSTLLATEDPEWDPSSARHWASARCVQALNVPNFRIVLGHGWDYEELKRRFLDDESRRDFLTDDEVELCRRYLKDWAKNGF